MKPPRTTEEIQKKIDLIKQDIERINDTVARLFKNATSDSVIDEIGVRLDDKVLSLEAIAELQSELKLAQEQPPKVIYVNHCDTGKGGPWMTAYYDKTTAESQKELYIFKPSVPYLRKLTESAALELVREGTNEPDEIENDMAVLRRFEIIIEDIEGKEGGS